jgi:hypothetical protein
MENKGTYFSKANKLFWGLIIVIIIFSILNFNPGIFKTEDLAKDIIRNDSLSKIDWEDRIVDIDSSEIKIDTSNVLKDSSGLKKIEYINRTWKWKSFDGQNYTLNFRVKKSDYRLSQNNRNKSNSSEGDLYSEMYNTDNNALSDMVSGYKRIIKDERLNYTQSMEMIVTSIQSIPYSWVLISNPKCGEIFGKELIPKQNCSVSVNPCGCCDNVVPYGVYSPVEFAVQKTADCDTRALFAYTILKKIGFDVAVMTSESVQHSVLGVYLANAPGTKTGNIGIARNYYLWELTSYGWTLGDDRMDGYDWKVALN